MRAITKDGVDSVVFIGEVLILGWLFATENLGSLGFAVLVLLAATGVMVLTCAKWPFGAVTLLIAASAMPRFAVVFLGVHVRPEHFAIGFVIIAVVAGAARGKLDPKLRLQKFDYWLLLYVGLNFFTSLATSPEPAMTLRWATLNAVAIAPYFLLRILIRDEVTLSHIVQILLCVGALEAVYGIGCFLSNRLYGTATGVEIAQYGFFPGTYGTQYEANLFGSYTACCAVLFLTLFLLRPDESHRAWYGWGFAITTVGAIVSLARSVVFALPVAIIPVIWLAFRQHDFRLRRFVPLGLGLALLAATVSPFVWSFVRERFSTIAADEITRDPTTSERLVQLAVAADDVRLHPILGTGTASFHLYFNWDDYLPGAGQNTDPDQAGWISNTPLRVLHDTGIVGLLNFSLFLGYLTAAVRWAIRLASAQTRMTLVALSAGAILYAITFQATEATMLAFTWIHLGLLATAVRLTADRGAILASGSI